MSAATGSAAVRSHRPSWWRATYVQVLIAILLGTLLGWALPSAGVQVKPLGDLFIRLVRMLLVPIVFATVTVGVAKMTDLKQLGRVGLITVLYFEIASTLALIIGLIVGNVFKPGAGINADLAHADLSSIAAFTKPQVTSGFDVILNIVPESIVQAFARGDMLPVLFFSLLFGHWSIAGGQCWAGCGGRSRLASSWSVFYDGRYHAARAFRGLWSNGIYGGPLRAFIAFLPRPANGLRICDMCPVYTAYSRRHCANSRLQHLQIPSNDKIRNRHRFRNLLVRDSSPATRLKTRACGLFATSCWVSHANRDHL